MAITREQLVSRAASRGYAVHESVTDDVLRRVSGKAINGTPAVITAGIARRAAFDASADDVRAWIRNGYMLASYALGTVGSVVVLPPYLDPEKKMIMCREMEIVAVVDGWGCDTEAPLKKFGMKYTVLRPVR
jgi:hypothetical protein